MKPLKYALLLGFGLMALSLRTPAAAQSASGLTKAVVPRHPQPLPDLDSLQALPPVQDNPQQAEQPQVEWPQRGIPTPRPIEIMMDEGKFDQAVDEFEKYMTTAQGDACDLIYLPYTFYTRLLWEDASKTAFYQERRDFYIDTYLQTCGNTVEGYLLKEERMEPKNPDSTVVWMIKAIALDPTFDIPYLIRGHALWALQRPQEACADYKQAAERQNRDAKELYIQRCANQ